MPADSVAVNQPLPPMMMIGISSAGTETAAEVSTSLNVARG
jgi:hypothetical protein